MAQTNMETAPTARHIHHYVTDGTMLSCSCGKHMYSWSGGWTTDPALADNRVVKCPNCLGYLEIIVQEVKP